MNVVFNIVRTVVMALVGLIMVPYYLDQLGTATYGIIPLATTMTSYVMIVCDSMTWATSRYSTLAIRSGKDDEAVRVFNTAFFGIARVCLILMPVVVVLAYFSPYIFSVPEGMDSEVQMLFFCVLTASMLVSISSACECVFQAHNKLYLLYLIKTVYTLLQVGMIVVMFNVAEPTLGQVGVSYLLSAVALFLMMYLLARKDFPILKIRIRLYSRSLFSDMGKLGFWSIVERVGSLLYIQISLVLVNLYLGAESEAGFAIVSSMISMVHTACYSVTSALSPLTYKCYADGDIDELIKLSVTGMKIVSLMFAFPTAVLMIFSPEILTTWVGEEHAGLADLLRIAFVGDIMFCAVSMINGIPTVYAKIRFVALMTAILGGLNALGAFLVLNFTDIGIDGVMWVWVLATSSQSLSITFYVEKLMGTRWYTLLLPQAYGYVVCVFLTGGLYLLSRFIDVEPTWLFVIPFFVILFLIYLPILFRLLMNSKDRAMVALALPEAVTKRLPGFLLR